jgi:hypothetical protein
LNRSIAAPAVVVGGGERLKQTALDEGVEPDDVVVVQSPLYARALAAPLFTASVRIAQGRRDAAFGQSNRDAREGREFCEIFGEDVPLRGGTRA